MGGAEIAKILKAVHEPADIRRYAERSCFRRLPGYLREVSEVLEAEQEYITSLPAPRDEAPKACVRLLKDEERTHLIQGLRLQFQQISAKVLKEKPRSKDRSNLEADLKRIQQDIDNLSRPYIFVEVKS